MMIYMFKFNLVLLDLNLLMKFLKKRWDLLMSMWIDFWWTQPPFPCG
jgi:hypothetical protein